jgi:flagellar P-ring protein precursor FlgI
MKHDSVSAPIERLVRALIALTVLAASAALWWPIPAEAARIKEVATVQGVRSNPLVGYGLVVGLDGTGDQTTSTPFTTQSINAAPTCSSRTSPR